MKRFYENATAAAFENAYRILLDGKPLHTPGRKPLAAPSRALAEAIAAEWSAQGDRIEPETMKLTRLANTVIDGLSGQESIVADDIAAFAANDLLCYRAGEPEGLVMLQQAAWDPVLGWASAALGARFVLAEGVMPVQQPPAARAAVRSALRDHGAFALAPLHVITTLTGSALLALALDRGAIDADAAWSAAHVDEDFQASLWGSDSEAEKRRAFRRGEFDAAVRMLGLLRG
jgi:chaperone required for assembly of F1-ATPase